VYIEGKMRRKNIEEHTSKAKELMELVHMDICGPMSTVTYDEGNFFCVLWRRRCDSQEQLLYQRGPRLWLLKRR
jgi:hypothetical protein